MAKNVYGVGNAHNKTYVPLSAYVFTYLMLFSSLGLEKVHLPVEGKCYHVSGEQSAVSNER